MSDYKKEIAFCSEKVCPDLSSLHYALLFQPDEFKAFWLGCFTLQHEIRRATVQQLEAGLTQVKLGWWRNALAQCRDSKAQHPVILAIGQTVVNAVDDQTWVDLINVGVEACEPQRYDNTSIWNEHLTSQLEPWRQVAVAKLGYSVSDSLIQFWVHSIQLTQILRLAKYIDQKFQPVPVQTLAQYKITAESLRKREHSEQTEALFNSIAASVTESAQQAWSGMTSAERLAMRPFRALFRMRLAELSLHRKSGMQLLSEQKVLSPGRKFWISWTSHVLRW